MTDHTLFHEAITGGLFDDNTHSAYRHFKQHSLERTLLGVLPQDPPLIE
jgi:hypothetical protein